MVIREVGGLLNFVNANVAAISKPRTVIVQFYLDESIPGKARSRPLVPDSERNILLLISEIESRRTFTAGSFGRIELTTGCDTINRL